jgi:hypothetical protein
MSSRRAPCAFRQTDVTRALKAARAAGFEHVRVEIDKSGNIVVQVGKPDGVVSENPLDQWMKEHARESQGD